MSKAHTHRAIPLALADAPARSLPAAAYRVLVLLYLDHDATTIADDAAHVRRVLGLRVKYNQADVRRALDLIVDAGLVQRVGGELHLPGAGEFVCRRARGASTPRNTTTPRVSPTAEKATAMIPTLCETPDPPGCKGVPLKGSPHYTPGTRPSTVTAPRSLARSEPTAEPLAKTSAGDVDRETFEKLQRFGVLSTFERFEDQPPANEVP